MTRVLLALAIALLPFFAGAAPKEKKEEKKRDDPSTNRTITVLSFQAPQYDTNGVKTAMLTGKKAIVYPDRTTEISEVGLDVFRKGSTNADLKVTSPKCFYNPLNNIAISEDSIRMARDNMVITGSNYIINAKEDRMQINHDVKIVFFGMRGGAFDSFINPKSNAPPKRSSNAGKPNP